MGRRAQRGAERGSAGRRQRRHSGSRRLTARPASGNAARAPAAKQSGEAQCGTRPGRPAAHNARSFCGGTSRPSPAPHAQRAGPAVPVPRPQPGPTAPPAATPQPRHAGPRGSAQSGEARAPPRHAALPRPPRPAVLYAAFATAGNETGKGRD